ncbi:imm11 family protein [Burkholderia sp. LMG 32019]|uniref:imm11 family protein n=1 Tax=Burkholderia sp. LMG 32019 TaxID=3158173 RepID=UPI003C2EE1B1
MTKIWTTEADYPASRMARYDEAASKMDRFELQAATRVATPVPLSFELPRNGRSRIRDYGVIWSDILVPLVNEAVRRAIEARVDNDDVQFIPAVIRSGGEAIEGAYFLLNPTTTVDVVDRDASEPIVVKIPGFPDATVGFRRLVLRADFPANGMGRQCDSASYIVVGDQLADAVLRAANKGVRFTTGIPPVG